MMAAAASGLRASASQNSTTPSAVLSDPGPGQHDKHTQATQAPPSEASRAAPNFSTCDGLTGLENAICRHEALSARARSNPGLANALSHLRDNLAKQHSSGAAKNHAHGPDRDDDGEAHT
jgi:hypothetical protein